MNLKEFSEAVTGVLAPEVAAGFTGRVSVDVDLRQGGIAKVSIRKEHDLRARTADRPPALTEGESVGGLRSHAGRGVPRYDKGVEA